MVFVNCFKGYCSVKEKKARSKGANYTLETVHGCFTDIRFLDSSITFEFWVAVMELWEQIEAMEIKSIRIFEM